MQASDDDSPVVVTGRVGALFELYAENGKLRQRGITRLEAHVPRGIYTLRETMGDGSRQELVIATPEGVVRAPSEGLPQFIATAIPQVSYTGLPSDYADVASTYCHQKPLSPSESQLFVFVSVGLGSDGSERTRRLPDDVQVFDLSGDRVELPWCEQDLGHGLRWAAATRALQPGCYRLRIKRRHTSRSAVPHTWVEQLVVLSAGWQTQVFITRVPEQGASGIVYRLDPARIGVTMAPVGKRFVADDQTVVLTELARLALVHGNFDVVAHVRAHLRDEASPMLRLFALAARYSEVRELTDKEQRRASAALLVPLAQDFHRITPEFTDGRILLAALDPTTRESVVQQHGLDVPPMLLSIWTALLDTSLQNSDIIPPGSLSDLVADRLFTAGVWCAWQTESTLLRAAARPVQNAVERPRFRLRGFSRAPRRELQGADTLPPGTTTLEAMFRENVQAVISFVRSRGLTSPDKKPWPEDLLSRLEDSPYAVLLAITRKAQRAGAVPPIRAETLAQQLAIPPVSVMRAAELLLRALQQYDANLSAGGDRRGSAGAPQSAPAASPIERGRVRADAD